MGNAEYGIPNAEGELSEGIARWFADGQRDATPPGPPLRRGGKLVVVPREGMAGRLLARFGCIRESGVTRKVARPQIANGPTARLTLPRG